MREFLETCRNELGDVIRTSEPTLPHATAFVVRLLGPSAPTEIVQACLSPECADSQYGGYPWVARLGFAIGAEPGLARSSTGDFLTGLARLRNRSLASLSALIADDLALLGIADGISMTMADGTADTDQFREWTIGLVDRASTGVQWSDRMRALAGDLLDQRGRLRVTPSSLSIDAQALELVLHATWPAAFAGVPSAGEASRLLMLKTMLTSTPPGDLERAAIWLRALDLLVDQVCSQLLPTVSGTVRILQDIQHCLKRWRWTTGARRRQIMHSRWLIDDEYDVQALLWAVLYPIYRSDLVDEAYLPNWGNVQPRADVGIISLKLIIEAKIARQLADLAHIEEQIAGDLGLYFRAYLKTGMRAAPTAEQEVPDAGTQAGTSAPAADLARAR